MNKPFGVEGFIYTTIPEWILDADISPYAVRLFGVLSRYVGSNEAAWPSRKLLAERMHCNIKTVDSSIKELVELGAISTTKRKREDGSYTSNFYYLWPMIREGVGNETVLGSPPNGIGVGNETVQHERTLIERTLKKDIISPKTEVKKTRKAKVYTPEFDALWAIYPRKENKPGAYEAYNGRIKDDKIPYEVLLRATEAYAKLRANEDDKFTLQAKTFYGPNRRYEDYLPKVEEMSSLTEAQLVLAEIYEDWDFFGGWIDPKTQEQRVDNPIKFGYTRPTNVKNQTVDINGKPYQLDNQGKRQSVKYATN